MKIFALASLALLGACSTAQIASTQAVLATVPADLAAACATASSAAAIAQATVKGGASNTVSNISSYVTAGCGTAQAIATLAADPSSTEWVGNLTTAVKAASAS